MRDTIARRSDVDKDSIKYEVEPGTKKYRIATITFAAKKDHSLDLKGLVADINGTRLSGKTNSEVLYLQITATGELLPGEKETMLKVAGTGQLFVLTDDPKDEPKTGKKTAYERLREALNKGEKFGSVTGRVQGWSGRWPDVLRELSKEPAEGEKKPDQASSKRPPLLVVTDFEVTKP